MRELVPTATNWSLDNLPADARQQVLDMAGVLERAAIGGHAVQTLRDKNVAVLCESDDCPGLDNFRRAAAALGARVTHIRPSDALATSIHGSDAVGNLLGRLYDAIDCHGVTPEVLDWLARTTGKPVFNELACQGNTEAHKVPLPQFTVQALLLSALA
jgi:ornithine carbamoyltransferase